jgi:Tfp pilus assembly protein FimT
MVELVIVIMVMAIMAAVAMPTFVNSLMHHRVEAAAHRVKCDLELAQHTARLTSAAQSITFSGTSYTMSAGVKAFDDPGSVYVVDLADEPYQIGGVTANFSNLQSISFNGYGAPASGGTVVIACSGRLATVTLNAATGEVTITSTH